MSTDYAKKVNRRIRTAVLRSITAAKGFGFYLVAVADEEGTAWTAKSYQIAEYKRTGKMPKSADAARLDSKAVHEAASATDSAVLKFRHAGTKQTFALHWEWMNLKVDGYTAQERYAEALVDGSAPADFHPQLDQIMREAGAY